MPLSKKRQAAIWCLEFVENAIERRDNDMLRCYYEQLNDLVLDILGTEE